MSCWIWALLILVVVLALFVMLAMCDIAKRADRQADQIWRDLLDRRKKEER